MNSTFFDQFMSPQILGIPLAILALLMPPIMFPTLNNRWLTNRLSTIQLWAINLFTKQLMLPINKMGHQWSIILTSLMIMLLTTNLFGLLPYTFTPTTQLSMNMGMAIPMWLAMVLSGLRNQPTKSLGHLLPEGTPTLLTPTLIIIETISLFIRPLALGVRLTANLTAGHLLIQLTSTATLSLLSTMLTLSMMTTVILLLLTILELAVAMIQAYVFVLLLSLYLQENV
ncbi:ATP synthase F0 subunit 6 (mitochondrion) [Trachemys scripta]|uniref:ATP synthase subunit a n=3 Tax=Trachemys scripta TaxID=34903 RepID=A0A0G2RH11_TRASE|nr:ATP synthase F0 subunit 6 [Trachemys scripta]AIY56577.1 ATP synthase F0 subunit 6 [Trachemys scripta elegans]QPQ74842.1 ATP synthase F0 subunit 6 [Trachemys scripta troostii]ACJ11684.1 ATP synthase F0 subunit 6 [Trachemys scripta]QPQ74829.1 ATP synthase F0 subunit 6 [Trachemys scripta]QPQ74855.1 ATP synthase F0 subunit 6 [Trachemys scripta elegans]